MIIPTTEPFLLPGDKNAPCVLLVHGFTGAPKEMHWMGEYLHQKHGFTCLGVRLAGHATRPEDMIRSRWQDWLSSVEDGYHLLRGFNDRIHVAGLSMGGVLSLILAARLPVKSVVAMATPYDLPHDPRLRFGKLLSLFTPYMPKSKEVPGSNWFDKEAFKDHISYPQNPVRSILELRALLAEMRAALPRVTVPALFMYSQDDHYLPMGSVASLEYNFAHIGSAHKEKLLISGSGHVLTRDAQRETVFAHAADFIQRMEQA